MLNYSARYIFSYIDKQQKSMISAEITDGYVAKTDEDKQVHLDLARTWALAAMAERHAQVVHGKAIAA